MMSIEEILERINWKKMIMYGCLTTAALFIFILLTNLFFARTDGITLRKSEFEYGEPISIGDYVDSVCQEPVFPSQIQGNKITLTDSDVSFTDIDTNSLGTQKLEFNVSNKSTGKNKTYYKTVTVIDSTPPEIFISASDSYTLEDFRELDPTSVASIKDNHDSYEDLTIGISYDGKAIPGRKIRGTVNVMDKSGNSASKSFTTSIKALPQKDETPENKEKNKDVSTVFNDTGTNESTNQTDAADSAVPSVTPSIDTIPAGPESISVPASQYFMFTDGYDMGNVESACYSAGDASGYAYACLPIVGDDGIYTGMELTFE